LTVPERQALEASLQEEIALPEASTALPQPPETPFIWPVVGRLNSPFGPRRARFHAGVDIAGCQGHPVAAAADGRVLYARASRGAMGKTVVLEHADGLRTVYAHLSRLEAREGATVRQGERIGAVGRTGRATGPHLHFEVRHQGRPVAPQTFLPGETDEAAPQLAAVVPRPPSSPVTSADPVSVEPSELPPPAVEPAS
jgi:murein DD-endopeptidase MepM/ murein hydrolase activator NlpD